MMKNRPPKIDTREFSELLKMLKGLVPHYTPEWTGSDKRDSGGALLKIFSHMTDTVVNRLNQVPHKNFVAFLDMLGIKLLPAQPARVPLTFKLAKGTEKDILIPARTQAATDKTEEHEELPFETEKNLLATISNIKEVISVDPKKDAIYLPPPGFLNGESKSKDQVTYKMASSPSAGTKDFQLGHVTGLEEGDFLKIRKGNGTENITTSCNSFCNIGNKPSDGTSSEYVIISGISGNIVSIAQGLSLPYPAGTTVEKVTRFKLFEGKNFQEHSLYLGHTDLFNMESTGKVTIEVALASGVEVGSSGLDLVWEYWGEDKENEKDDWLEFQVQNDGTNGFKQSGKVTILKTKEGKIKEEKLSEIFKNTSKVEIKDETIKEIKTRWLRCRLKDALTTNSSIKLPTIDTIFIKPMPGKPIPPDAGFFNDVPLDWTLIPAETTVVKCKNTSTLKRLPDATYYESVCVASVEGFGVGDLVALISIAEDGIEEEAIIKAIYPEYKIITFEENLSHNFQPDDKLIKQLTVSPFGKQPRLYDAFYIGSQEAFSKKDAKITLALSLIHLDTSDLTPDPKLSWEYWNGTGWQALTIVNDTTDRFLQSGDKEVIEFYCPEDIEETEVSGQKNYWIRVRIVGGDYGREEYTLEESINRATDKREVTTKAERKYKLPVIRNLTISYSFEKKEELQYCLTYNNLAHRDKTSESRTQGLSFQPFVPLDDTRLNLYLGFDSPLKSGPIRIFFDAKELPFNADKKPKLEWTYSSVDKNIWGELNYLDATEGLIKADILELIGPSDFSAHSRLGDYLYWVKGSLVEGEYEDSPLLDGIYPNTTWAFQAETIKNEILGSSDGEPDQTFSFLKFPVIKGQEIRVREILSEEEKQALIELPGEDAIHEVKDETGKVTEIWVLWKEAPDFFDSTEHSRHYTLDRATGEIQFGDGINGMIPPVGDDNIKAFLYQAGGGAEGNVKAGEIKTLKSAVAGVDKASNTVAADGGADTATLDEMLEIGPAMISHRNRAVTAEDFEWLAKEASRKVVKVRCLPNINNGMKTEVGWVTVIIVPDLLEDKPFPSLELRRKVRRYLEAHSANTLTSADHIYLDGPSYIEIGVSVDIFVSSIDVAYEVEREVRAKLNAFFHPLTGGPERKGWDFGRNVSASDIYALLEDIEGVDHVENLRLTSDGTINEDVVEIKDDFLVANGTHEINLQLANGG